MFSPSIEISKLQLRERTKSRNHIDYKLYIIYLLYIYIYVYILVDGIDNSANQ